MGDTQMSDNTNSEGGPTPSPSPTSPKRGIPRILWIAIAAVVVVLIVAVVGFSTRLVAATDSSADDKPDAVSTDTAEPSTSSQPSTEPSASAAPESGAPSGQSTGDVSLDDAFVLGTTGPAIWQIPSVDGWTITTLDQQGVTAQTNEQLGCTFTTVQNQQVPVDATATSDRAETEATVQAMQKGFLGQSPSAQFTNTPGLAVPYGATGIVEGNVEFAGFRADYVRDDTGETWSSMFVTRTMPQIEGMMYSVLNCAKETIDSDETIWRGMLDQTVVASGDTF
jgi:cytoskeletal protein RodZ